MTTTEDQAPPATTQRVTDQDLGGLILHFQGGGAATTLGALDLALDLAQARADARHQAQVRQALAATARTLGNQARKAARR